MNPFKRLHKSPLLRSVALPLLKRFNPGDIRIRHHYTKRPFLLHSYRHKGYWYHGRRRERRTMDFFAAAIEFGSTIAEVGGHIGYIATYYAQLAGTSGRVVVFEPGSNNLPYLRENAAGYDNLEIVEQAASDSDGEATFFEEGLTGQNNSLHADYDVFQTNRSRAYDEASYRPTRVETRRLDSHFTSTDTPPALIKIDVEGAELGVLRGAERLLRDAKPVLMVEVTREKDQVYDLLTAHGYELYDDRGRKLQRGSQLDFNVCAIHPDRHASLIDRLGWPAAFHSAQVDHHAAA